MAKTAIEPVSVTRQTLSNSEFVERLANACVTKMNQGAFGALSFEQCLALTSKKRACRMNWKEFEGMVFELVKSGDVVAQNGKYYPRSFATMAQKKTLQTETFTGQVVSGFGGIKTARRASSFAISGDQ
jgi:hypothetical protein